MVKQPIPIRKTHTISQSLRVWISKELSILRRLYTAKTDSGSRTHVCSTTLMVFALDASSVFLMANWSSSIELYRKAASDVVLSPKLTVWEKQRVTSQAHTTLSLLWDYLHRINKSMNLLNTET